MHAIGVKMWVPTARHTWWPCYMHGCTPSCIETTRCTVPDIKLMSGSAAAGPTSSCWRALASASARTAAAASVLRSCRIWGPHLMLRFQV
jgi:hypothetical protein